MGHLEEVRRIHRFEITIHKVQISRKLVWFLKAKIA
jgi:hypothetical protein